MATLSPPPRFWQWPTILSLDAPLVALLWQSLFARGLHVRLEPRHRLLLAAAVWLVYVADRWLDAFRMDAGLPQTRRHRFHLEYRWPLLALWLCVLAASSLFAGLRLTLPELEAGFVLLAAALAYLALVHLPFLGSLLPKEALVAVLFAAGVGLFVVGRSGVRLLSALPALGLFALLCFLNTALIARWERLLDAAQAQPSLATRHARLDRCLGPLCWFLAAAPLLAWPLVPALRWVWPSLSVSALALLALERAAGALPVEALRALADAALLVPALFLGLAALP